MHNFVIKVLIKNNVINNVIFYICCNVIITAIKINLKFTKTKVKLIVVIYF